MENPFESGHIRNYILFYAGVVLIMVLFFFANTLFNTVPKLEKKVFNTQKRAIKAQEKHLKETPKTPFKLKMLERSY